MKLFQTIQRKFAILGISPDQSIQNCPFNQEIILVYIIYGSACIMSNVYLFHEAQNFEEYTNNIYITTAATMLLFFFTIIINKMANLFEFIDNVEKLIDSSE